MSMENKLRLLIGLEIVLVLALTAVTVAYAKDVIVGDVWAPSFALLLSVLAIVGAFVAHYWIEISTRL